MPNTKHQHDPADFEGLNDYFDHVYVLTLEGATDRQGPLTEVLAGLNWDFFYGVNKHDFSYQALKDRGLYDEQKHRETKRSSRNMSVGEIACAMSHRNICQDIVTNNYRRALILEDDVLPVYQKLSGFKEVVSELPENWELLMLGYYGEKMPTLKHRLQLKVYLLYHYLHLFNWHKVSADWIKKTCLVPYKNHLYTLGKLVGGHAYAVSYEGARKFVDYQEPIIIQADRVFNYYDSSADSKAFAMKEKLFTLSELSKNSYIK